MDDSPDSPRRPKYRCRGCGYQASQKWRGRCPGCGFYYNLIANRAESDGEKTLATVAVKQVKRIVTGCPEFDRVLNGGLVRGSSLLLYGEPGGGKSTILMQTIAHVCGLTKRKAVYSSGEQNDADIGYIAQRVGALSDYVIPMGNEGDVDKVIARAEEVKAIMVVIDSVQTAFRDEVGGAIGSPTQLTAIANYCTTFAKQSDVVVCLVGQVNSDGEAAGPERLKHLVDCCLRIDKGVYADAEMENIDETRKGLRTISVGKYRYGPENVEAVVEMMADGSGVRSPSAKARLRRLVLTDD